MKHAGKALTFLVTAAMLLSLLPAQPARAEAEPEPGAVLSGEGDWTAINNDNWSALLTALNAGGQIRLGSDVTATESSGALTVPAGKTATLDLNGHVIDRGGSGGCADRTPAELGLTVPASGQCKLLLVNGTTFAPLCEAWDGRDAD